MSAQVSLPLGFIGSVRLWHRINFAVAYSFRFNFRFPQWVSFAIGIELTHDMPVQRPEDANPRVHQRPAILWRLDQRFAGGLPFW